MQTNIGNWLTLAVGSDTPPAPHGSQAVAEYEALLGKACSREEALLYALAWASAEVDALRSGNAIPVTAE